MTWCVNSEGGYCGHVWKNDIKGHDIIFPKALDIGDFAAATFFNKDKDATFEGRCAMKGEF